MSLDFSLYEGEEEVFDINITHNLGVMADKAGIYEALWHPEKISAKIASDVSEILKDGLEKLKSNREHYEQFNASNGGTYKHLVPFVEKCYEACIRHPDAVISVSV